MTFWVHKFKDEEKSVLPDFQYEYYIIIISRWGGGGG